MCSSSMSYDSGIVVSVFFFFSSRRRHTRLVLAIGISAAAFLPAQTFTRDVAPVLQRNCQACHRPGEAAPFSLLTYEQARPWAKAIKAAVLLRKMPPWYAD